MITKVKELIVNATTSKEYIEYVKYHENNILSITKVSRWELVHSNYIAWILNPYETHGLGFYPICRFLQMLCNLGIERFPAVHSTDIFCDEHKIRDVEIIREQPVPTNGQNKRSTQKIDLLIKVKFEDGVLPIVIENKVGSGENGRNNDQTVDYFHWGETVLKSAFDPIYLCLVPLFNNIAPACPNFFVINYQHMVDNIIEPCMWRTNNAWTRDTIKIYLQCLSYQNDNEKGHNTMAISSEERKILDNFIQNNRIFIDSLLDIFADGATEEEKKATVERFRDKFNFADASVVDLGDNRYGMYAITPKELDVDTNGDGQFDDVVVASNQMIKTYLKGAYGGHFEISLLDNPALSQEGIAIYNVALTTFQQWPTSKYQEFLDASKLPKKNKK